LSFKASTTWVVPSAACTCAGEKRINATVRHVSSHHLSENIEELLSLQKIESCIPLIRRENFA